MGRRLREALERYPRLYRRVRCARLAPGRRLPPRRVDGIDLGCGHGHVLRFLKERLPGGHQDLHAFQKPA